MENRIRHSKNKGTMQFSLFEDEARPEVIITPTRHFIPRCQDLCFNQTEWPHLATISTNEGRTCFE